jgi:DDE family transposase
MLALAGTAARRWEPRRLRFRLFATAGRIVRGSRRTTLRLAGQSPWASLITTALTRLNSLAPG